MLQGHFGTLGMRWQPQTCAGAGSFVTAKQACSRKVVPGTVTKVTKVFETLYLMYWVWMIRYLDQQFFTGVYQATRALTPYIFFVLICHILRPVGSPNHSDSHHSQVPGTLRWMIYPSQRHLGAEDGLVPATDGFCCLVSWIFSKDLDV